MPKVSIITPVYADISQKVDWLNETIQSIISQTLVDWEMIIIDDKSPLPVILQSAYENEPRIRWFQNAENFGPAMTRNTAVALAESDCILPLDADDLLASDDVLEQMYDLWSVDKTKIIYGNLQPYQINSSNQFERGRVIQLADYTFELAMNLNGIMPVTAMHSVECWQDTGGWKNDFKEGLEDVEYWLMAGKQGYCGQKIEITTFLYRRHETSRAYVLKHGDQDKNIPVLFRDMQQKIKTTHNDVYEGRFPMSCCGGKGKQIAQQSQMAIVQSAGIERITELQGYEEKDKIWVEYKGGKKGGFDILARGSNVPQSYHILGTGHKFQAHKKHEELFRQRARLGYVVGIQDPRGLQTETPKPVLEPSIVEVPKPQLSTIVRPDQTALSSKKVETATPSRFSLDDLNLTQTIKTTLESNNYTVENIANESLARLMNLPGIGEVRANRIIGKAKELINTT